MKNNKEHMRSDLISSLVNKELNERFSLNNDLRLFLESMEGQDDVEKDEKDLKTLDTIIGVLDKVKDTDMSDEEIEQSMDEGILDSLGSLLGLTGDVNNPGEGGVTDIASGSAMTQMKEWLIRKFLVNFMGMESGKLVGFLSGTLSELSIPALLSIARGTTNCKQHSDEIADAFMIGISRMITGDAEKDSMGYNVLKNVGDEFLKNSNAGEYIADKVCSFNLRDTLKTQFS
jgi:hypothetical protein